MVRVLRSILGSERRVSRESIHGEKWESQRAGGPCDLGQPVHRDQSHSAGCIGGRGENRTMEFKISLMDSPGLRTEDSGRG